MNPVDIMRTCIGKEFSESPSPFMRWLKPVVKTVEQGALAFACQGRAEWLNPVGNLHGGVTAAIIDDVLGATIFSPDKPYFYTGRQRNDHRKNIYPAERKTIHQCILQDLE